MEVTVVFDMISGIKIHHWNFIPGIFMHCSW